MILFGEDALRIAVREFVAHYHGERNHQGREWLYGTLGLLSEYRVTYGQSIPAVALV